MAHNFCNLIQFFEFQVITDQISNLFHQFFVISRSSIDEQLKLLNEKLEFLSDDSSIENISKSKILTLVLYFIESEHHFTGNGVWMDEHWQPVENQIYNHSLAQSSHARTYNYGIRTSSPEDGLQESSDTHTTKDSRRSVGVQIMLNSLYICDRILIFILFSCKYYGKLFDEVHLVF